MAEKDLYTFMNELGTALKFKVDNNIIQMNVIDTGELQRITDYEIDQKGSAIILIYESTDYAKWVEKGIAGRAKAKAGPRPFFTKAWEEITDEFEEELAQWFEEDIGTEIDNLIEKHFK